LSNQITNIDCNHVNLSKRIEIAVGDRDQIYFRYNAYVQKFGKQNQTNLAISDNNWSLIETLSFDPCSVTPGFGECAQPNPMVVPIPPGNWKWKGRWRNANDWTFTNVPTTFLFDRGYTGHEHLDKFNLINMLSEAKSRSESFAGNGRIYDPLLGCMLSPDNYVQAPDNSQNFNRYSYALNNPLIYTDPDGEIIFTILAAIFAPPLLPIAIAADIGGIINTANNWGQISKGFDKNFLSGLGKLTGYYGVGGGKAVATYYGGPIGTVASSYLGDACNSLLVDGTFEQFDAGVTTQNLFVDLAVGQLSIGNSLGDAISKNIGNELIKNTTKQIISQNVNGLLSDVGKRIWQTGSLRDGLNMGWNDYSKQGGWWKYSLSGAGQGYMDTYDFRTIARNENKEAMKDYYKEKKTLSGFIYPLQPDSWGEKLYHFQMKMNSSLNLRLYSPTRNFFNYTLPKWSYPELYQN